MIVMTGATGTIGRLVIGHLLADGAGVRAVTRDPATAGLPAGVEVVPGDPARPATLAPFLDGAEALFLHARAARDAAGELVALAREHGVRKVVALAALNVGDPLEEQPSRHTGDRNKEAEDAAVSSGLDWVSLRPSAFAGNAVNAWAPQIRAGDVVRYVYATPGPSRRPSR